MVAGPPAPAVTSIPTFVMLVASGADPGSVGEVLGGLRGLDLR